MRVEHLAVLAVLLGAASAADLATRRIPNLLVLLVAGTGLVAQVWIGGLWAAGAALLAAGCALAAFLPLWLLGGLGGGDLKLAVAGAVWAGGSHVLAYLLLAGIAGIPVALATVLVHRLAMHRLVRAAVRTGAEAAALAPPRPTVPLAVAISLGLVLALFGRTS